MRIIHSSDWHLGHKICQKKRTGEFEGFLDWLLKLAEEEKADLLICAGDVFDGKNPGHWEQSLYYDFLARFIQNEKRHLVISSGNHDSAGFLAAPKEFLKRLGVQVAAEPLPEPEPFLIPKDGRPGALVCALPYFREGDLRRADWREDDDLGLKIALGLKARYDQAVEKALNLRACLNIKIPIIATGHLFVQGGKVEEDDGSRPLYLGNLGQVPADIFSSQIDYLALGHLHRPQMVGGRENFRYSGSILPMNFQDGPKSLCLLDLDENGLKAENIEIPVFQNILSIKGDLEKIRAGLAALPSNECWLEIVYDGEEMIGDLKSRLDASLGENHKLLRLKNLGLEKAALGFEAEEKDLKRLKPQDIFERLLTARQVPENQWSALKESFEAILFELANREAGDDEN